MKFNISPLLIYRLVRLAFGIFFIAVGFMYPDGWPCFLFGGLFIATAFLRKPGCVGDSCGVEARD